MSIGAQFGIMVVMLLGSITLCIYANPVLNVGHRGFNGLFPENTMISFGAASKVADMIEFDVRLSKDGHVVVIHDNTLDRTTNGSGLVRDKTVAELQSYDAGSKFDPSFRTQKIPTLDQVFGALKGLAAFNVEIKNELGVDATELVHKTIELIKKHHVQQDVVISFFDHSLAYTVHDADPCLTFFLLFDEEEGADCYLDPALLGNYLKDHYARGAVIDKKLITQEIIHALHQQGFSVGVFTVNTLTEIALAVYMNIDYIISDFPDRVRHVLNRDLYTTYRAP